MFFCHLLIRLFLLNVYGFDSMMIESIKTGGLEKYDKSAVCTLDGVKLNTTDASDLPKGIYIVNGKKVVVK